MGWGVGRGFGFGAGLGRGAGFGFGDGLRFGAGDFFFLLVLFLIQRQSTMLISEKPYKSTSSGRVAATLRPIVTRLLHVW